MKNLRKIMGCVRCMYFSGPIVSGVFLILGLLSFVIPYALYESNKVDGLVYEGPPTTVIVFHWLSAIAGFSLGIAMHLTSYHLRGGIIATTIISVLLLVFWICYQSFFFTSDQFQIVSKTLNEEELNYMIADGVRNIPYLEIIGFGKITRTVNTKSGSATHEYRCYTDPYYHEFERWTDETILVSISREQLKKGYLVKTSIEYELSESGQNSLETIKMMTTLCVSRTWKAFDPGVSTTPKIRGVVSETLATLDGSTPSGVNDGIGAVLSLFFCGISYSYHVARLPILHQVFVKTNATLSPYDHDDACDSMGTCIIP